MAADTLTIIYDGDCPFCSSYVPMARLREAVGTVELVDARSDDPRVAEAQGAGLDLDDGMVVIWRGERHDGADAVHLIAALSGEGSASGSSGACSTRLAWPRGSIPGSCADGGYGCASPGAGRSGRRKIARAAE